LKINFRNYTSEYGFKDDFFKIFEFFKKYGAKEMYENWHWARWEWLIGHPNLEEKMLPIIGIWECNDVVVAVATHDMRLGKAYIMCNPEFKFLQPEMLKYAENKLSLNCVLKIAANNTDLELIELLEKERYRKCEDTEEILSLKCADKELKYSLPEGYIISCFAQDRDSNKRQRVIWKGFENEGFPPLIDENQVKFRPHFNPSLTVFTVGPDGEYASHCGMWYDPNTEQAYVEPVVTIPEHRRLGLGKAAVYECVNRCSAMGAKVAQVISNQQFYYSIGFKKTSAYTFWEKKLL
jgi:GNAT superfamily N-acetyltransferase